MLSLENSYNADDLADFDRKAREQVRLPYNGILCGTEIRRGKYFPDI